MLELVQGSIIYTRSSQVSFKLLFNIVFTSKKRKVVAWESVVYVISKL